MCSAHFLHTEQKRQSDRVVLSHGAIPSIFEQVDVLVEVIDAEEDTVSQVKCYCHIQADIMKLKNTEIINTLKTKIKEKDGEILALKRKLDKLEAEKQLSEQKNKDLEQKLENCIPLNIDVSSLIVYITIKDTLSIASTCSYLMLCSVVYHDRCFCSILCCVLCSCSILLAA